MNEIGKQLCYSELTNQFTNFLIYSYIFQLVSRLTMGEPPNLMYTTTVKTFHAAASN